MNENAFVIDGAGQWALDRSHMPGGATPIVQELMTRSLPVGMRRVFKALGVPADTLDLRFVHGFMYTRLRPLIAPDKPPKKLPPLAVLKLAMRLHPEMRRRAKIAERTLRDQPWTAVIHDWEHGGRAAIESRNLEFQAVNLTSIDNSLLIDQVNARIDHAIAQFEHHFWLHGFDLGPIGIYLYDGAAWGLTAADLLPLLEGASPSTSAPRQALCRLRELVDASGATPTTLAEMRAISPVIGAAVDDYLHMRSALLFSRYDVDGITLGERPELVFASVMTAAAHDTSVEVATRTAAVRERVPVGERGRFDDLLRQARSAMNLRDDNGPTTAEWPMGLVRLALLELGDRLAFAGRVHHRNHALELRIEEITVDLFAAEPPASADALVARAVERKREEALDAPLLIGPDEPAPPLSVMPASLARMVGMVQLVIAQMGMDGAAVNSGLHGCGVGTRSVRGRARVADSPEAALDALEPGDILVVRCTTPAYNVVLSLAGGVVTADGGPMSHAAVLARELGIPAVVGARNALIDIPDGAEVEVDPVAGVVRVLVASDV